MAPRSFDAFVHSQVLWEIVGLVFLSICYWTLPTVRVPALILAWLLVLYSLYAIWASFTAQDRILLLLLLVAYISISLLALYLASPHRPVSRLVTGVPPKGTIVAGVSMLDVGASPVPTLIPNPPGWHDPSTKIHLLFKDSPLLTNAVREQITRDLSVFREYLLDLDIPVPNEFPPIGVGSGPGSAGTHTSDSLPAYRSSATINAGWILDRRSVTAQYVHYVVTDILKRRLAQHPTASHLQDMIAASAIAAYYNWSFWDYKADNVGGYWSSQLWDIRSRFGKQFADRLVGFALKGMVDNPEEDADPRFDFYFYNKIKIADSIVDNNAEKMGEIKRIIEKFGIDLTTPRAYFTFSATAVKRHDMSYVVKVVATNRGDASAEDGTFRVYFAPDVRLLREPKGALKDATNTLKSARMIPFKSIAAHAVTTIELEFMPLNDHFYEGADFFLIDFSYSCHTCGSDTHYHSLKFPFSAFEE